MAAWISWSLGFSVYLALVAALRPGMTPRARVQAWMGAAAAAGTAWAGSRLAPAGFANVWVLPPAVLLIGYWSSGRLFVRPMLGAERVLASIDGSLRVQWIATRCPRVLGEFLELAYSGIYVAIVIALLLVLRAGGSADRFWTVILVTDFACFGMLPWFQTRPPRAVGFAVPWRSSWREVNERLLDAGGVHVNTFPSGHAAEALAAALLVIGAPWPLVAWMFANALAVSAGAVLGRYHYALDAFAGWAVALLVWWIV
jgi:membrane-associated phospholipid phosphatase